MDGPNLPMQGSLCLGGILILKKPSYRATYGIGVVRLAFPDHQGLPAHVSELGERPFIVAAIPLQLGKPVIEARFWEAREATAIMPMPKAAVNHYHFLQAWEDQVRGSGQIASMKSVPVAKRMCDPTNAKFRFRIRLTDAPHMVASLFRRQKISHGAAQPEPEVLQVVESGGIFSALLSELMELLSDAVIFEYFWPCFSDLFNTEFISKERTVHRDFQTAIHTNSPL